MVVRHVRVVKIVVVRNDSIRYFSFVLQGKAVYEDTKL